MLTVNFNPQIFNPIYLPYLDKTYTYELYYGSAGSGKSQFIAQKLIYQCLRSEYFRCVYGRKVARNIRDSSFKLLTDIIFEYKLNKIFTVNKQEMDILCINGNELLAFGMDDPEKIKSVASPSHIWIDELTELSEEDVDQLILRLRTPKTDKTSFIGSFNPIDEKHHIKKNFFDTKVEDCLILKTTYLDNKFIDQKQYEKKLDRLKNINPARYRVYKYGEWGKYSAETPYFSAFDDKTNTNCAAVFQQKKYFRISFDFNVDNCVCVFSHAGVDFIHFFDELSGNNLPHLLEKIDRKYGLYVFNAVITGDRSGQARHHMQSDNINSYIMIKNRLNLKDSQFKIIQNPPHKDNRFTCNTILAYHPNVFFHPENCKETIYDLRYVECDQNENIIKKDRSQPTQKADLCDCVRYTFNTFHHSFVKNFRFKK